MAIVSPGHDTYMDAHGCPIFDGDTVQVTRGAHVGIAGTVIWITDSGEVIFTSPVNGHQYTIRHRYVGVVYEG